MLTLILYRCDNSDSLIDDNSRRVKEHLIEITDSIKYKQNGTISFYKITHFEWDTLYIFIPYTSTSEIDKRLGFHWKDAGKTSIQNDEISNLLVFTKGRGVIAFFDYPRDKGDFINIEPKTFSKNDARFKLKEEKNGIQKKLFFYSFSGRHGPTMTKKKLGSGMIRDNF